MKELGALNSTTRTADQTAAAVFWQFAPSSALEPARPRARRTAATASTPSSRLASTRWSTSRRPTARSLLERQVPLELLAAEGGDPRGRDRREPGDDRRPELGVAVPPSTVTTPALATPPFPDHPSGHGCVSGAVLRTCPDFFGTDKVAFDMRLRPVPTRPCPRHFDRFSLALKEVIDARVWGGIHFRTADVQGAVMGKKVAFWLQKHYFNPVKR